MQQRRKGTRYDEYSGQIMSAHQQEMKQLAERQVTAAARIQNLKIAEHIGTSISRNPLFVKILTEMVRGHRLGVKLEKYYEAIARVNSNGGASL